jgi:putative transposase
MARKPRFNLPGIPQHVIQRGNNREPCFFAEEDYRYYLEQLGKAANKMGCAIHAYVLMTNHVHLLVTPLQDYAIPSMMQSLGRRYVRYINHTYRRTGTLWEGRYKASLVDSERYVLTCYHYIELNPVRAVMTQTASEYRWSSYRATALGEANPLLTPHEAYLGLGCEDAERRHAYRELFRFHMDDDVLHDIRTALNQEMVLGSDCFKDRIDQMVLRRVRPGKSGRPRLNDDTNEVY